MHLKILLPYRVFADDDNVARIVVVTSNGSLGLLPNRLDFSAAIVPGILMWQKSDGKDTYAAVDVGIMVKTGADVFCSVRNAVAGVDLGKLHEAVNKQFIDLSTQEVTIRNALTKLENGLLRSLSEFTND
jgi:F-type H+-transporting ATPase subunit epsilon